MDDQVQQLIGRRLVLAEDALHGVHLLAEVSASGVHEMCFLPTTVDAALIDHILLEELSTSDREAIARIARKELKGEKIDDRMLRAVRNALTSLFQTLYTRRTFWSKELRIGD